MCIECRFVLQKKVIKLSENVVKVERGCSANCDDRDFIWADEFMAHCCSEDMCNTAVSTEASYILLFTCAIVLSFYRLRAILI